MLCLRGDEVFMLVSTGHSRWPGTRVAGLAVFSAVPCFTAPVVCVSVSQGGCRRSGLFGFMAHRPLAWQGCSLAPSPLLPPQAICDPVPWCSTFSEAARIGAGVTFVPQPPALGYEMLAGCVP